MNEGELRGLKDAVKDAGFTQEGFAKVLGVSYSSVARWISGKNEPNLLMLKTMARLLNCTTDKLLGVDDMSHHKRGGD